jgi:hypothetical protein
MISELNQAPRIASFEFGVAKIPCLPGGFASKSGHVLELAGANWDIEFGWVSAFAKPSA